MLHKETILVSPFIYKDIQKPNNIDLNNSFSLRNDDKSIGYKRGEYNPNNQALKEIIGKYRNLTNENVILTSSGVCLATMLAVSKEFNRILYYPNTYPEMKDAYNTLNTACELKSLSEMSENDLLCIETHKIPECTTNLDTLEDIIEYVHSKKAFILIDNSHLSLNYNPFDEFDIDFELTSLSKHTIGFNNSLVGCLICNEKDTVKQKFTTIRDVKSRLGFQLHPLDCYFISLGLQTLQLRMNKVQQNEKSFKSFLSSENIPYTNIPNAGVFFIKTSGDFDSSELYKLKLYNVADTFGSNFTVFKHWNDFGAIRISLGIENEQDLIDDFKNIIPYLKAHLR